MSQGEYRLHHRGPFKSATSFRHPPHLKRAHFPVALMAPTCWPSLSIITVVGCTWVDRCARSSASVVLVGRDLKCTTLVGSPMPLD